jgi:hypothetical protein
LTSTEKKFSEMTVLLPDVVTYFDALNLLDFSSLASLTTLQKTDVSFCDFKSKADLRALSFIPRVVVSDCFGLTGDNAASGKVEPQEAESPNEPTDMLIKAMRNFAVPPYIDQSFSITAPYWDSKAPSRPLGLWRVESRVPLRPR